MACETGNLGTPGQLLSVLLDRRGWSQRTLAVILQIGESTITRLVADKQAIDAKLAILLEEIFAVPAEEFLSRQVDFDLARARQTTRPDHARARRARLFGELPVSEMIQRGWIDAEDIRDLKNVEDELARFLGANGPEDIAFPTQAMGRAGLAGDISPRQMAWLRRVEQIAGIASARTYAPEFAGAALRKLKELLASHEAVAKVPRILAECGIRFVIVEPLAETKIDGACLWLNDQAPVVAMSLRVDEIDAFWLILRQQIEHVVQRHGRTTPVLDTDFDGKRAGRGPEIRNDGGTFNQAVNDFCVPSEVLESFLRRKAPIVSGYDMVEFAHSLGVHPGILAGMIQRKTGGYERFGVHKKKIRSVIVPFACCDGWGKEKSSKPLWGRVAGQAAECPGV